MVIFFFTSSMISMWAAIVHYCPRKLEPSNPGPSSQLSDHCLPLQQP